MLVGDFGPALPGRLIRHGAYFDFMVAWGGEKPTTDQWSELVSLLKDEITASRMLYAIIHKIQEKKFWLFHRPSA